MNRRRFDAMKTRVLLTAALLALPALPALAQQPAKCQLVKIAGWPVKISS